jgi:tetratricopeptide (TPR) repeat protein
MLLKRTIQPWAWWLLAPAATLTLSALASYALKVNPAFAPAPQASTAAEQERMADVIQADPSATVAVQRQPLPVRPPFLNALETYDFARTDTPGATAVALVSANRLLEPAAALDSVSLLPAQQAWHWLATFRHSSETLARASALTPTQPISADKTAAHDQWLSALRLGDVLRDQGRLDAALQSYQVAFDIAQQLAGKDPGNTQWQSDLSQSYTRIAEVQIDQGQLKNALQNRWLSLALMQRLVALDPANLDWQQDLAARYSEVGDVLFLQGSLSPALEHYQMAWGIMQRLVSMRPGQAEFQVTWALLYQRLGHVQIGQGQLAAAWQNYEQHFAILERLVQSNPSQTQWLNLWGWALYDLANLHQEQGLIAQALQKGLTALALFERLVTLDPANAKWKFDVVRAHDLLGMIYLKQGRSGLAGQSFQKGLAMAQSLVSQDPNHVGWLAMLSSAYGRVGKVHQDRGEIDLARQNYLASLRIDEALVQHNPSSQRMQRSLIVTHVNLGNLEAAQGHLTAALEHSQLALVGTQKMAEIDASDVQAQLDLSSNHRSLGTLFGKMGNLAQEQIHYQTALIIVQALVTADPSHPAYQLDLSQAHLAIGRAYDRRGMWEQAIPHYAQAQASLLSLVKLNPNNFAWSYELARCYSVAARAFQLLGGLDQALSALELAVEINQRLAANDASNATAQEALLTSYIDLVGLYNKKERPKDALLILAQAQAIAQAQQLANPEAPRWYVALVKVYEVSALLWIAQARWSQAGNDAQLRFEWASKLVALDPQNREWLLSKVKAQQMLGTTHLVLGRLDDALVVLKGALTASQKLVATSAANDFEAYEMLVFSHLYLGALFLELRDPEASAGHLHATRTINHQFLVREGNYQIKNMEIDTQVVRVLVGLLKPLRERTDLSGLVLTNWQRLALQDFLAIIDGSNQILAQQNKPPLWLAWLERFRPWVSEVAPEKRIR